MFGRDDSSSSRTTTTTKSTKSTTTAKSSGDGRINLNDHKKHWIKFSGGPGSQRKADGSDRKCSRLNVLGGRGKKKQQYSRIPSSFTGVPRMNICILITGSRGDVQPFIALGQALQAEPYNHTVRIGTHGTFRGFVKENGLDFFSIGGDPEKLMAYMQKNPGIIPGLDSIKAGDIAARKQELEEMLMGAWKACTEGADPYELRNRHDRSDDDNDDDGDDPPLPPSPPEPFVADAIISNPATYASLHIAEKLAIPLHMMFTMPWSPTTSFPHPLAQLDSSRTDRARLNYMSYTQMEAITWLGLADIINRFRRNALGLDAIDPSWGTKIIPHLKIPFTYCWSPALIPKPADWGDHISISGFFFLNKASTYQPDPDLQAFLAAGPPPVYIGFGSIVADDPAKFTKLIFDAVRKAGVRALVSRGWSKIGGDEVPENVFMLGNVPHDWLFNHVSAVVHHGGAGTCAIGLKLARPTVIVPFFGDQFWWAGIVARAGAGPKAVAYKDLTADKLAANITAALQPEVKARASELAQRMEQEDGVKTAAEQFHQLQQTRQFACFLCPDETAVWRLRRTNIQLGPSATAVLLKTGRVRPDQFKLVKHKRWYVEEGVPGPLTGIASAIIFLFARSTTDGQDYTRSLNAYRATHQQRDFEDDDNEKESYYRAGIDPNRSPAQSLGRFGKQLGIEVVSFPMHLLYNIAVGCHNAPFSCLNDTTVRIRPTINGVGTGLEVAAKEILFAVYDSATGLVTHPYRGYKQGVGRRGGPAWGAVKGVGKGIGGIAFRAGAASFAIPGYGLKGIEQALLRLGTNSEGAPECHDENVQGLGEAERATHAIRQQIWHRVAAGNEILERRVAQVGRDVQTAHYVDRETETRILERWELLMRQTEAE